MIMNKENGRLGGKRLGLIASTFALCVGATGVAMAANVLQDVRYTSAPGGKVDITLQFAEPVGKVQAFTTDTPPRIAIDLPDTSNALKQRRVAVGSGATSAVTAAESGGRTRVVVDLFRPAGYTTRSDGNLLVLTVDAGAQKNTASTAMANAADPLKRTASDLAVSNVDFRRGENGSGRVILRFNGEGASADMRTEGNQVFVDISNAQIPERLRRQLDVTDFATPVQSLEPRSNAGGSRLVINTNGPSDTMAYQTGNEYVVEVTPKNNPAANLKAAGAVTSGGEVKRYVGKPVTFNFQDVPVRTVLQLIAEESSLNVVASDTVSGNLTLRLINVPWDQALEIILRAKSLDQRRDGNVVWIAPQKELADFEQARADARIAMEVRAELKTEYIPINYGTAEDIANLLTEDAKTAESSSGGSNGKSADTGQRGFISPRGSVSFDSRSNTLLVSDTEKNIEQIKELLKVVDRPVDQVLIEARIVIANESFARELGARFGISNPNTNANSTSSISGNLGSNLSNITSINSTNLANANALARWQHDVQAAISRGTFPPARPDLLVPTITRGLMSDLAVANPAGSVAYTILRGSSMLDLELSALEEEGRGSVLANPRVITSNQREAIIRQGQQIGFVSASTGAAGGQAIATPAFKDVVLELKVTPTITSDGRVFLTMNVKKDDVLGFTLGVPSLSTREVSTAVLVGDGQTVVVGGVYEFSSREDMKRVPFFGDLPVLGNLFRNKGKKTEKAELLIFVTPRVLQVAGGRQG